MIDINMGCPVPKVVKNGEGSALMQNTPLAAEIVREMKKAVNVPITVKMRIGWDEANINAVEFAKAMEEAGAEFIGGTRAAHAASTTAGTPTGWKSRKSKPQSIFPFWQTAM